MPYSTLVDVRTALTAGGIAVDDTSAAGMSDENLTNQIAEADAMIDGYLTARYALPIVGAAPALLQMISRDLAAYYGTLTYLGSVLMQPTHPVQLRLNSAMATLEKIRDGDIMLSLPGAGAQQRNDNPSVANGYDGDMFSLGDFDLIINDGFHF